MNNLISLIDKLEKSKPAAIGEVRNFGGKDYKKVNTGDWRPVVHQEEKKLQAMDAKKEPTPKQSLEQKLQEKTQLSMAEKHVHDLKNKAIIEDRQTKSGKPMFLRTEDALAHGYTPEDFAEVSNVFYERAQMLANAIQRHQDAKQKVEPAVIEAKDLNLKISKQFLRQSNAVQDRQAKTAQAVSASKKVKKSVTSMGHNDSVELNTGDFAQEFRLADETGWLESFHTYMANYSYGDTPREILLPNGSLFLAKVDDGLYSGFYRSRELALNEDTKEPEVMEDNAKIRIERITLPSLVQLCLAKEWIHNKLVERPVEPIPLDPMPLIQALEAPIPPPVDRKIKILELLNRLLD